MDPPGKIPRLQKIPAGLHSSTVREGTCAVGPLVLLVSARAEKAAAARFGARTLTDAPHREGKSLCVCSALKED